MGTTNTQLRYVRSKDPDKLISHLSYFLPYKVEIKGNPVFVNKKWYLWFIIPEDLKQELPFGDLD